MNQLHRHPGTIPWSWPAMVASLLLALSAGCSAQPPRAVATTTPGTVVDSTMTCFGVTARLALVRTERDTFAPPSSTVRGLRWHLDVTMPPDMLATEEIQVSLDTFAIRGDQAVRNDLVALRLSGRAWPLATEGAVRVPELPGGIRAGDQGRVLVWLQTPRGTFGVRGIIFDLTPHPEGLEGSNPSALPAESCPTS